MTKQDVRKCQIKQLEALKFIDQICRENGLTYFVHTGTLLGAVRHHGYIPWDMDTDILMPMVHARIFVEKVEKKKDHRFSVQYEEDGVGCHRLLLRTGKMYRGYEKEDNRFIHIDIYSFANAKTYRKIKGIYLEFKHKVLHRLMDYRLGRLKFKNVFLYIFMKCVAFLYRGKSNREILDKLKKDIITNRKTGYVSVYNSYYGKIKETYPVDYFKDNDYIRFEDMEVPIPCGYIKILENLYGDWKVLPPKEERWPVDLKDIHYEEIII